MLPSENFKVVDVPKDDPDFEEVSIKFKEGITEGTGVVSGTYNAVNSVDIKSVSIFTINIFTVWKRMMPCQEYFLLIHTDECWYVLLVQQIQLV